MPIFVIYTHALPSFVNIKDWGTTRGLVLENLPNFSNTSNALHVVVASVNEEVGEWACYEGVVVSKDWERDHEAMKEMVYRSGNKLSRNEGEQCAKKNGYERLLEYSWRY